MRNQLWWLNISCLKKSLIIDLFQIVEAELNEIILKETDLVWEYMNSMFYSGIFIFPDTQKIFGCFHCPNPTKQFKKNFFFRGVTLKFGYKKKFYWNSQKYITKEKITLLENIGVLFWISIYRLSEYT